MPPPVLRLAYVSEFLLALIAGDLLWSQVGGQGHLDLMPWYGKLLCLVGLALITVRGTAAAISQERAWNANSISYLLMALMIAGAMAAMTYYYHLHEEDSDENESTTGVAQIHVSAFERSRRPV
jgi:hypothetical protein